MLPWSTVGGEFASWEPVQIYLGDPLLSDIIFIVRTENSFAKILERLRALSADWFLEAEALIRQTESLLLIALLECMKDPQASQCTRYTTVLSFVGAKGTEEQFRQVVAWMPVQWHAVAATIFGASFSKMIALLLSEDQQPVVESSDLCTRGDMFLRSLLAIDEDYAKAFSGFDAAAILSLLRLDDHRLLPLANQLWTSFMGFRWFPFFVRESVPPILREAVLRGRMEFVARITQETDIPLVPGVLDNELMAEEVVKQARSLDSVRYVVDHGLITKDRLRQLLCYMYAIAAGQPQIVQYYDEVVGVELVPKEQLHVGRGYSISTWMTTAQLRKFMLVALNEDALLAFIETNAFKIAVASEYDFIIATLCERAALFPNGDLSLLYHYLVLYVPPEYAATSVDLDALYKLAVQFKDSPMMGYLSGFRFGDEALDEIKHSPDGGGGDPVTPDAIVSLDANSSPPRISAVTGRVVVGRKRQRSLSPPLGIRRPVVTRGRSKRCRRQCAKPVKAKMSVAKLMAKP